MSLAMMNLATSVREPLGLPGLAALCLLLAGLAFQFAVVAPDAARLAGLQAERARLSAAARSLAPPPRPAPSLIALPVVLKGLHALAAASGLSVERVTYDLGEEAGVQRLALTLPVSGSYPALRDFLREALQLTTTAGLSGLSLQRPTAGEAGVMAQFELVYRFRAAP